MFTSECTRVKSHIHVNILAVVKHLETRAASHDIDGRIRESGRTSARIPSVKKHLHGGRRSRSICGPMTHRGSQIRICVWIFLSLVSQGY